MRKKKIMYLSDAANALTGFGNVSKRLLTYLYKTGKYEIIHLAQGVMEGDPNQNRFPWKVIGVLPNNPQEIQRINTDPGYGRFASYGGATTDRHVQELKPDVFIAVNDPWGATDIFQNRVYWNKISSIGWITYDSLPLHQPSLDHINNLKHLYCWSTFAENEFKRLGHSHVKTMFPPVDTDVYKILSPEKKKQIRDYLGIPQHAFVVNYVARDQLRKLFSTIIEGYGHLQREDPLIAGNTILYFHCSLDEGWNLRRFAERYNVDYQRIWFTWICKNCKHLEVKPDNGNKNCKHCKAENSQVTCNVGFGATVEQMCWIYNSADCFVLPANSGATELPGTEAMSCGLPLATIDYAYGHDFCLNDFVTTLQAGTYLEFGTQFEKRHISGYDIKKFIKKTHQMPITKRWEIGQKSRKWIVDNFSIEVVGKKWEEILDSLPFTDYDFNFEEKPKNPNYIPSNNPNDIEWVLELYKNVLNMDVDAENEGTKHWLSQLNGKNNQEKIKARKAIHEYFVKVAVEKNNEIQSRKSISFNELLIKNDKKHFLVVCPESAGDILNVSSCLESLRQSYPKTEWNIYFACKPEFIELLDGCEYVDSILPYQPFMDHEIACLGQVSKGMFQGYCFVTAQSQRVLNYLGNHNVKEVVA